MLKELCICAALAFDPETLPSLESIDAQSDITPFMQPCVPDDLRVAALRRAWSADQNIRDFKGMAENAWDFTDTRLVFGFDELDPDLDGRMLAEATSRSADRQTSARPAPIERASIASRLFRRVASQFSTFK
jgi:hypothetical protein